MSPRSLRWIALAVALLAAAAFLALAANIGFGAILAAMGALGWHGFVAIAIAHLIVVGVTGLAWWLLGHRNGGGRLRCFVWGRLIRDSAAECLPFSQLGGFVLGARAAALCGVSGGFAAASSVVDVTMELVARVPYMLLALAMLLWLGPHEWILLPAVLGTVMLAAASALFFALQANGAAWIDAMIVRLGAKLAPRQAGGRDEQAALQHGLRAIHADRRAMAAAFAAHLAGWVLGGFEVALALWLMGVELNSPLGMREGIVIDSVVAAIRSVGFALPNLVGVQEGAFVVACALFGIDARLALALALLRRGRDFAIGIPALLAWQLREGQSVLRAIGRRGEAPNPL